MTQDRERRIEEYVDEVLQKGDGEPLCLAIFAFELIRAFRDERDRRREQAKCIEKIRINLRAAKRRISRSADLPDCLLEFSGKLIEHPIPSRGQPCVYFLIDGDEVVYIGQSRTVGTRLAQHVDKKFNRVLVLECQLREMDALERELIARFAPKFNRAGVPVRPELPREVVEIR